MYVEVRGISEEELRDVLVEEYGWDESNLEQLEGKVMFTGYGNLRNVVSEESFHNEIYQSLKLTRPDCKVRTRWTCLEDIPCSVYGDNLEDE